MATLFLFFFYWILTGSVVLTFWILRNLDIRLEKLEKRADASESSNRGNRLALSLLAKRMDAQESASRGSAG